MADLDYHPRSQPRYPAASSMIESARLLRENGGTALSDLDVLAIVLGPGRGSRPREAARKVLEESDLASLPEGAGVADWWEALRPAQGMRLAAALELARRVSRGSGYPVPCVNTPNDVFEVTADLRLERREHFVGLYLNTRNRLLARETISVGSLNASIVHPREVFEPAVRRGAATVIVVHNHPSGETDPSEDDVSITQRLGEAGEILGISLLDHVIVGARGFTSMKEAQHL